MKYFKPKSLTWWSGIIPVVSGLFVSSVDIHGMVGVTNTINNITGHLAPATMITTGLIAIGLRGKDG